MKRFASHPRAFICQEQNLTISERLTQNVLLLLQQLKQVISHISSHLLSALHCYKDVPHCKSLVDFSPTEPVLNFCETDMDVQHMYHFILPEKSPFVKTWGRSDNITTLAIIAIPMTAFTSEWSHNRVSLSCSHPAFSSNSGYKCSAVQKNTNKKCLLTFILEASYSQVS